MVGYDLPKSATIGGREYEFRSDYRAILDLMQVMADNEIEDGERAATALAVFFISPESIPTSDLQEAIEYMYWFVGGGETRKSAARKPRLMDWQQDFPLIVAPMNKVLGYEVRSVDYLHWWSFLAAYQEIGDCLFAQVVSIRRKQAKGKKLEKHEREFLRDNYEMVSLAKHETDEEKKILEEWM